MIIGISSCQHLIPKEIKVTPLPSSATRFSRKKKGAADEYLRQQERACGSGACAVGEKRITN